MQVSAHAGRVVSSVSCEGRKRNYRAVNGAHERKLSDGMRIGLRAFMDAHDAIMRTHDRGTADHQLWVGGAVRSAMFGMLSREMKTLFRREMITPSVPTRSRVVPPSLNADAAFVNTLAKRVLERGRTKRYGISAGFVSQTALKTAVVGEAKRRTEGFIVSDSWIRQMATVRMASYLAGWAARLHDVGKLVVPSELLDPNIPLKVHEYAQIKRHTQDGHQMIAHYLRWPWDAVKTETDLHVMTTLYQLAQHVALTHHDRHLPGSARGETTSLIDGAVELGDLLALTSATTKVLDTSHAMLTRTFSRTLNGRGRTREGRLSPYEALAELSDNSEEFHPAVVEQMASGFTH